MSFYWAKALNTNEPANGQQQSQLQQPTQQQQTNWDNINLGGAQPQQNQWGQHFQSNNTVPNNPQQPQNHGFNYNQYPPTNQYNVQTADNHNAPNNQINTYNYAAHTPILENVAMPEAPENNQQQYYQAYHTHEQHAQQQQRLADEQQQGAQQQKQAEEQQQLEAQAHFEAAQQQKAQTQYEAQRQEALPTHEAENQQQAQAQKYWQEQQHAQQYYARQYQEHQEKLRHSEGNENNHSSATPAVVQIAPVPKETKEVELTVEAKDSEDSEEKTKVTPTSSEDDWVKTDIFENDGNKKIDAGNQEHLNPPSSGTSCSPMGNSEQNSVDMLTDAAAANNSWIDEVIDNSGESSEKEQETNQPSKKLQQKKEKSPAANEKKSPEPVGNNDTLKNISEPIATSTPKDDLKEKRGSITSQTSHRTDADKTRVKSDDETASVRTNDGVDNFQRSAIRASYRNYREQYNHIWMRLNGHRIEAHRTEFRPSSKMANPLLAAAGITNGSIRNQPSQQFAQGQGRNEGRSSVPLFLLQSRSFNEDPRRSMRVNGSRPSSRQSGVANTTRENYGEHSGWRRYGYNNGRETVTNVPYHDYYDQGYAPEYSTMPHQNNTTPPEQFCDFYESDESLDRESDDELRQYNSPQKHVPMYPVTGEERYYLGIAQLNMHIVDSITQSLPLPPKFYNLTALEKAAFIYYSYVYRAHYKDVDEFHKRFNREFYKYVCDGDSKEKSLAKVCRSISIQHQARMEEIKKNLVQSHRPIFSDDSVDGQSESSISRDKYDGYEPPSNGPMKFSYPHAFLNFGPGGKTIDIQPGESISVVNIDVVVNVVKDHFSMGLESDLKAFKGPLNPQLHELHTVRAYVDKQINAIKNSEVALENPKDNDVVDALLIWELLATLLRQRGAITGPDVAEILMRVTDEKIPVQNIQQPANPAAAIAEYTKLLLGGHVLEAIESAMQNNLHADALLLARRLHPRNSDAMVARIEAHMLQSRSMCHPVTTLAAVASGDYPAFFDSLPLDGESSWRTHLAIILANLGGNEAAFKALFYLARTLAKRDYNNAAHFCFLVLFALYNVDVFGPADETKPEEQDRPYITLISSGIPDDIDIGTLNLGFSLMDLHATEVLDYVMHLKDQSLQENQVRLQNAFEYQKARIEYAKVLAKYGFASHANRYIVDVLRAIWDNAAKFDRNKLLHICELGLDIGHAAQSTDWDRQVIELFKTNLEQIDVTKAQQHQQIPQHEQRQQSQEIVPELGSNFNTQPITEFTQTGIHMQLNSYQSSGAATHKCSPKHEQNSWQESSLQTERHMDDKEKDILPPNQYTPQTPFYNSESADASPFTEPTQNVTESTSIPEGIMSEQKLPENLMPISNAIPPEPPVLNQPFFEPVQQRQEFPPQQPETIPEQPEPISQIQEPVIDKNNDQSIPSKSQVSQSNSIGWLGTFKQQVAKAMPGVQPMNLPNDSNPQIIWDSAQNRYVGEGVEKEPDAPPPPVMSQQALAAPTGNNGRLRLKRAADRYTNVGFGSSSTNSNMQPPALAPPMPTGFGFIPAPTDDAQAVDPFSGEANPSIQMSVTQNKDELGMQPNYPHNPMQAGPMPPTGQMQPGQMSGQMPGMMPHQQHHPMHQHPQSGMQAPGAQHGAPNSMQLHQQQMQQQMQQKHFGQPGMQHPPHMGQNPHQMQGQPVMQQQHQQQQRQQQEMSAAQQAAMQQKTQNQGKTQMQMQQHLMKQQLQAGNPQMPPQQQQANHKIQL
ncbi:unnamed protein product [Caenorhabditis bovis]|uniref:Protein transport protein sec16 n=1 Tax=Caenorhabditis bovis TaxID=2654633 RepID=A0A8S1EJB1_9PELO|nr:unnamed protein product [Caenorhabditis bovis]